MNIAIQRINIDVEINQLSTYTHVLHIYAYYVNISDINSPNK